MLGDWLENEKHYAINFMLFRETDVEKDRLEGEGLGGVVIVKSILRKISLLMVETKVRLL